MKMQRSEKIGVAFIALFGVIFSGLLSYIVSQDRAEGTVENLRIELDHKYNVLLYNSRLETYPSLYKILGDIGIDIEVDLPKGKVNRSVLAIRLEELNKWDNKNTILLSPSSYALILRLRQVLHQHAPNNDRPHPNQFLYQEEIREIFDLTLALQEEIRKEIGVYDYKR